MLPIQKMLINYNFTARGSNKIEYIIVHNTANASVGAGAVANRNYFAGGDRQASADFFVDDKNIVQAIDYHVNYSWAVGDGHGEFGIWNNNSVSLEICENPDMDYNVAVENALDLVRYLMKELNLGPEKVVRHYDASHKNCPHKFNNNGDWSAWDAFKAKLVAVPAAPVAPSVVDYEKDIIRIIVDGVQKIAVTGLTKAKTVAQQYSGHVILTAKTDGKQWDLGVVNPPVPKPAPAVIPTPAAVVTPAPAPFVGTAIMGKPVATANQCDQYIRSKNPNAPLIANIYFKYGGIYCVRDDVAFAQMCWETHNYLFDGRVPITANNPAGLGATDGTTSYETFPTIDEGVEAQFQHLLGYATGDAIPSGEQLVDARFKFIKRGDAPWVEWLGINENPNHVGWASDPGYGSKVLNVLDEILKMPDVPVVVPQPIEKQAAEVPAAQPSIPAPEPQPEQQNSVPQEPTKNGGFFNLIMQFLINFFNKLGGKQ